MFNSFKYIYITILIRLLQAFKVSIAIFLNQISYYPNSVKSFEKKFREETGFGANIYKSFGSFFVAPGYSSEITEYFIAEDLFESPLEPDVDEEIELEEYTLDEAFKLIKTNKIIDQGTISALNIYKSIL